MFVKRISSVLAVVFLINTAILSLVPSAPPSVEAAQTINYSDYDYYVQNMTVIMSISPLGNVEFFEYINFTFNRGNYSMAFREIPHEGFETLTGVEVLNETGESLSIGSKYEFDMFKGKYVLRWPFNPKLGPTNASFYISYITTGAVESVARDQLGIDWNVIGKGWNVPIKQLYVWLFLPSNVTKSPLFKYYPKDAKAETDRFSGVTLVSFNRSHISAGKTVRVIAYYPKNYEPQKSPERLLRENSLMIALAIFLAMFFACLAFVLFRNVSGRLVPKTIRPNMNITKDPIKLTTLIQGKYTPLAFFAGLVHLAQAGFATIEDDRESGELWVKLREEGPDELTVQLTPRDGLVLAALTDGPPNKPMHELWNKSGHEIGGMVMRDLKNDGLFSRSSRFNLNISAVVAGALLVAIPMIVLMLLIETPSLVFYSVIYGGIFLGMSLGGTSLMVLLGFCTPRHTSRGAYERSQQAANLESISYLLDKTSKSNPDDVPALFDKNVAILTSAPLPLKGGFPTYLRKVGAQAPDPDYHHPWYFSTAADPEAPKGRSFGTFSMAYADTLDRIGVYFRGKTSERPEERPPVEGPGPSRDSFSATSQNDVTAYHDLEGPSMDAPISQNAKGDQFEVIPVKQTAPPTRKGALARQQRPQGTKGRPPQTRQGPKREGV